MPYRLEEKNPADSCIFMRTGSQVDEDFRGGIKVKKKFSVITFGCAIAVAILAGCKTEPESGITTEYTPAPEQLEVARNIVKEYVDPETGVHYLTIVYDPGTGELKFGGITPRFDSNGQIMIDQVTK